jgi:hypothetical protein
MIRRNLVLAARASAGAGSVGVVAARAGRHVEDVGEERLRKGCKSVLSLC